MAIPMERGYTRILSIRVHRVMLDTDLAVLYGVLNYVSQMTYNIFNSMGGVKEWRELR